jgi:4-amino-4-deoxy-L-arabinose transferase-like glycosyltransferase
MLTVREAVKTILRDVADPKKFNRLALVVLGIALAVRLLVFAAFWNSWEWRTGGTPDQWNELAINLVDYHTLGYSSAPSDPSVLRGPIFPVLLAPLYILFSDRYWIWSIALLLFDTGTCFLLILLARKILGERAALLAGIFYALNLPIIYYTAKINQMTTMMPMVIVWWYLFCLWEKDYFRGWIPWALGLTSGLMILNKTVYLPVPIICSAVLVWIKRSEISGIRQLTPVLIYFVISIGVVAPWTYRNFVVTKGSLVPVQAYAWQPFVQNVLFYDFEQEKGLDAPDGEVIKYVLHRQDEILIAHGVAQNPTPGTRALWDVQCEKAFADASMKWIKENPTKILKAKVANIWQFWVRAENWRKTRLFIAMQTVYLGAAVFGGVLMLRFGKIERLKFGLLLVLILWLEHCPVWAYGRLSLDLVPILGLLLGLGVDSWATMRGGEKWAKVPGGPTSR